MYSNVENCTDSEDGDEEVASPFIILLECI